MSDRETIAPLAAVVLDDLLARQHALALGPGLGDDPATDRLVVDLLRERDVPAVVDADALNAFARLGVDPAFASDRVVLTPYPGELARLTGLAAREVVVLPLHVGARAGPGALAPPPKGPPTLYCYVLRHAARQAPATTPSPRGGAGDRPA